MESYTIIILIFGLLITFLLICLYFINQILQYKIKIDNSFIAVEELLVNLDDYLEEILEFLKRNKENERTLFLELSKAKDLIKTVKNNVEGINTIKKIEAKLELFYMLENTYKSFNKNKEYLKLKEKLLKFKDKLIYAMDIYDKGVIEYNNYTKKKYIYILSRILNFKEYNCYNKDYDI